MEVEVGRFCRQMVRLDAKEKIRISHRKVLGGGLVDLRFQSGFLKRVFFQFFLVNFLKLFCRAKEYSFAN